MDEYVSRYMEEIGADRLDLRRIPRHLHEEDGSQGTSWQLTAYRYDATAYDALTDDHERIDSAMADTPGECFAVLADLVSQRREP